MNYKNNCHYVLNIVLMCISKNSVLKYIKTLFKNYIILLFFRKNTFNYSLAE